MLKRKVDLFLENWKKRENHRPLIVYGARQMWKTTSIRGFGKKYKSFIEINFIERPEFKSCFNWFNVNKIVNKISIIEPNFNFIPNETLILFDEIQSFMDVTTSLKFFSIDGRFDVICSGSSFGITNKTISSVAVGYKEELIMHSLDFEEFLWARGYKQDFINSLLEKIKLCSL